MFLGLIWVCGLYGGYLETYVEYMGYTEGVCEEYRRLRQGLRRGGARSSSI